MAPDTSSRRVEYTIEYPWGVGGGYVTPIVTVWRSTNSGPSLYPAIRPEPETPAAARLRRSREAGHSHALAARLVPQGPRESRWRRPVRVGRACGSRHMVSR